MLQIVVFAGIVWVVGWIVGAEGQGQRRAVVGPRVADNGEAPMLKVYIAYTALIWLVTFVAGSVFGYSDIPAGQLWTQTAGVIIGY